MSKNKKLPFERKNKANGVPNPKYVDLLELDKPIAGQSFGCFSFISPEKIVKQKELFFFQEFLKKWDIHKSMERFHPFLNFLSYKYNLSFDAIMSDFEQFIQEERENITSSTIEIDYHNFLDREESHLEQAFNTQHQFQTSVRGFKARGNFSSQEEAELRAKLLRESDPSFDVFVGPIGTWLPWEPDAYKTGRVEYMEEELNQLVQNKKVNEEAAKSAFDTRLKETKQKAIEDNKKNAQKYGSTVTQDVDKDGNLIGVKESFAKVKGDLDTGVISVADIRKELFEGDNIVVPSAKMDVHVHQQMK
jgi:hypothetical protein